MKMFNLCRLCSSTEKIIDVYTPMLVSGDQLRHYLLLATGIEILWNDPISRMVCHRCCEIAVKLHKYRSNAIANDKLLKEKCGQPYTSPITDKDELLAAASKVCNLSDVSILRDGTDPLELLNIYIEKSTKKLERAKSATADMEHNFNKIVNLLQDSNEANIVLKESTIKPSTPSPVSETTNITGKPSLQKPVNNDISHDSDISEKLSCSSDMEIEEELNTVEQDIQTPEVNMHPSIKQLFTEYNSVQIPKEVYMSDISPMISLDPAEVSDWYAEQLQKLKEKLKNARNPNILSSSEDEGTLNRPRLRKRKRRRIIECSDTDDDEDWVPNKVQPQEVKNTKPLRPLAPAPNASNTTVSNVAVPSIQNILPTTLSNGLNYAVVTSTNLPTQPLQLNFLQYPLATVANTTDTFLVTQPNTQVLQSLLSSNDQTLSNLYTDFSRYGINIENSDPPIQYGNATETVNANTFVLEPIAPQKQPENVIQRKSSDEVICISDDESNVNAAVSKPSEDYSFMTAKENEIVKLLFKKHFHKNPCQESQTFDPTKAVVHRTKRNLIALPNMVGELKRYKIPIDLEHSQTNVARFEMKSQHPPKPTMDTWTSNECVDVFTPGTKNISTTTSPLNNQRFVQVNSAITNHSNNYSNTPIIVNHSTVPVISDITSIPVTLPNTNNLTIPNLIEIPTIIECDNVNSLLKQNLNGSNFSNTSTIINNGAASIINTTATIPVTAPTANQINCSAIPDLIEIPTTVNSNKMNSLKSILTQKLSVPTLSTQTVLSNSATSISNNSSQNTNKTISSLLEIPTHDKTDLKRKILNRKSKPIVLNGISKGSLRSLVHHPIKPKSATTSTVKKTYANRSLLQNYLQAKTIPTTNTARAVVSTSPKEQLDKQENQLPILIDNTNNLNRSDIVTSKIRVKNISELIEKV